MFLISIMQEMATYKPFAIKYGLKNPRLKRLDLAQNLVVLALLNCCNNDGHFLALFVPLFYPE